MSDSNTAFSIHIKASIDFSTMKENSKGSIKGDVCCTRACIWLGLEQCRGGNFGSQDQVQRQKSTD